MTRTASILLAAALAVVRPRSRAGIAGWVSDLAIPIPSKHNKTYEGERYVLERFPVVSSIICQWAETKGACELILLKPVQSTASTVALFAAAHKLVHDPGNIIMITDTRDQMRDFVKDRIKPIFGRVPGLSGAQEVEEESTALALRFPGGTMYLGGGQSTTAVISKPASMVLVDEVSKHPLVKGMTTTELGRNRLTGDDDGKLLVFSTPDDECEFIVTPTGKREMAVRAETVIHSEFLSGTQEVCEVPCPHCGAYQELVFDQLRFGHCKESLPDMPAVWNKARVLRETYYECAECHGRIEERQKKEMIRMDTLRWVARNLNPHPRRRSATFSALYDIAFESRTWGAVALAFLDAVEKGDSASMKAFHTEYLGKAWSPFRIENSTLRDVKKLTSGKYRRKSYTGEVETRLPLKSNEVRFIGMTCDVQLEVCKWLIFAVGWDGQMWILDWGEVQDREDLEAIAENRLWRAKDSEVEDWGVSLAWIDTGFQKKRVYEFLARARGLVVWEGVRGRSAENTKMARIQRHWKQQYPVEDRAGFETGEWVTVNNINAEDWEHELYVERIARRGPVMKSGAPWVNLPVDADDVFLAELANMKQEYTKPDRGGIRKLIWKKIRSSGANDYGDMVKYGLVMIHAVEMAESRDAA